MIRQIFFPLVPHLCQIQALVYSHSLPRTNSRALALGPSTSWIENPTLEVVSERGQIQVYRKIEDVIEGRDAQLERIVELIETTRGRAETRDAGKILSISRSH